MVQDTYKVAEKIVGFLQEILNKRDLKLPSVRNVYITGSFIRGDWLNMSSDLDIQILFKKESPDIVRKNDLLKLQSAVAEKFGSPPFPSQAMSSEYGIDYGTNDYLPQSKKDITNLCPFMAYNIYYFDFYQNRKLLYGNDFSEKLPEPIDVVPLVIPTVEALKDRMDVYRESFRFAYAAYKIAVILQLYFGQKSIDKRKILDLYLRNVPEFPLKFCGEIIIRNYIGSYYPERPPHYFDVSAYKDFARAALELLEKPK